MSYEAWGDGDEDDGSADRLLDAGWWSSETVLEVQAAIKDLTEEPVYENGDKANGISVRFLARLTLLKNAAELIGYDDPLVVEARAIFAPPTA